MAVIDPEGFFGSGFADYGIGAALPFADGAESINVAGSYGDDVALLGFIAPDFHGRHARLIVGHLAQFKGAAAAAVLDQFGKGVGQAASADIVNKGDGVMVTQLPALIDNFLAA